MIEKKNAPYGCIDLYYVPDKKSENLILKTTFIFWSTF